MLMTNGPWLLPATTQGKKSMSIRQDPSRREQYKHRHSLITFRTQKTTGYFQSGGCSSPPPEEDFEASKLSSYVFEDIYKPWPFRAYGFLNKDIDLLPEPHACELRIQEITNWLENNLFSN